METSQQPVDDEVQQEKCEHVQAELLMHSRKLNNESWQSYILHEQCSKT